MGNKPTTANPNDDYIGCQLVDSFEILALGKFDIYWDPQTQQHYLAYQSSYAITNVELAESEIGQLRKLESITSLCFLLKSVAGNSQMLCFENYSIFLKFEYHIDSISSYVKSKSQLMPLPESHLWQVASDLADFLIQLSRFGVSHGDLQPRNVLFTKAKQTRILMPLIYTTYQNAYRLRLANDAYKSTFSPEALSDYNMRNNIPTYDAIRADIFSLGICLLSYIHCEDYQTYYNFKENTIFFDRIKERLSRLIQLKYSEELFFLVNLCVKQNAFERATLDSLTKVIRKRHSASQDFKLGSAIQGL